MTEVAYCTREMVQHALNQADSVRNNRRVDQAILAGARDVQGWVHRRFYPETDLRYPDPRRRVLGDVLWLNSIEYELLSVTSLVLDGTTAVAGTDFYLEPETRDDGQGYTSIRLYPESDVSWPAAPRTIALTGVFGSSDATAPAGALAVAISSTSATTLTLTDSSLAGVGDLITIGTERLIVTEKEMIDTTATVTGAVDASDSDTTIPVSNGALIEAGELVLIGAERMFVESVSGNTLVVKRKQNASTLAAHVNTDVVYAPRLATVERGVLGTTVATHLIGAAITRNRPPSLITEFNLALALNNLEQGRSAYAREVGQGENAREAAGRGVKDIAKDCVQAYGRLRYGATR